MRFRFPKSVRLQRASEFLKIKAEGHSNPGRYLVIGALQTGDQQPARFGIITSRRIGGAVERNRVRRRLRELARKTRPQVQPGFQLVIIARRHAVTATFGQLEQDWLRAARRAGILKQ